MEKQKSKKIKQNKENYSFSSKITSVNELLFRKRFNNSKPKESSLQKELRENVEYRKYYQKLELEDEEHNFKISILRLKSRSIDVFSFILIGSVLIVFAKAFLDFVGFPLLATSQDYSYLIPSFALSLISALGGVIATFFYLGKNK